ncbi:MAG TPA: ribosome biogenesis GTPase Der [Flavobacteriales bacterium]|nr:ribosome biogenesis GTPase Der [Flavobacteriales bacterium]|tara:strand:- start:44185 stop:45495 length:1311 start_codon:yes stop_codon:yes gene_type:complete
MGNIVAIVGRPNVGKSTLFNRLTQSRDAIVNEESGVTRDRHYGYVEWNGKKFTLVDTGGYVIGSDDTFEAEIRRQVEIAINEADLLLFMVDVTTGITDLDEVVADLLRKHNKKVILVANKVDNFNRLADAAEFYSFGLGEVQNVSSISGSGTGDLLDLIVNELPNIEEDSYEDSDKPNIAIVGRPNVGKSSFLNTLLGEERNIVTDIAGTTRDAIATPYKAFGFDINLIDTAGLRKKGKVHENLEFYSVMRTIRAIENSDVCIVMIDAQDGVMAQDLNILHLAIKNKKGIVILVNKWDLIEKETDTSKKFTQQIKQKIAPFTDVPIIFTSVKEKQRIFKALETAIYVFENRKKRIPTAKLNEVMLQAIQDVPPPATKGKYIRIKYATQLPGRTPAFAFFCNLPQYVKEPYKRYLENKIRANFDFTGVPISIFMRKK